MPYGLLTDTMLSVVAKYVRDRVVYDLGAGDMQHARQIKALGAENVIGVDTEKMDHGRLPPGVQFVHKRLQDVPTPTPRPDVLFISWPVNRPMPGLVDWTWRAGKVIYLGSNLDGDCCGTPALFEAFLQRDLLEHVTHRRNTLLVLGTPRETLRTPTIEELAGMDYSRVYTWP
jgi:hypothetical protein